MLLPKASTRGPNVSSASVELDPAAKTRPRRRSAWIALDLAQDGSWEGTPGSRARLKSPEKGRHEFHRERAGAHSLRLARKLHCRRTWSPHAAPKQQATDCEVRDKEGWRDEGSGVTHLGAVADWLAVGRGDKTPLNKRIDSAFGIDAVTQHYAHRRQHWAINQLGEPKAVQCKLS